MEIVAATQPPTATETDWSRGGRLPAWVAGSECEARPAPRPGAGIGGRTRPGPMGCRATDWPGRRAEGSAGGWEVFHGYVGHHEGFLGSGVS
jgi:hypothetical protein